MEKYLFSLTKYLLLFVSPLHAGEGDHEGHGVHVVGQPRARVLAEVRDDRGHRTKGGLRKGSLRSI